MFCCGSLKEIGNDLVAHSAVFRRGSVSKGRGLRHVGFVAEIASSGNLSRMRHMALSAGWELPVNIMAGGTGKGAVFALKVSELPGLYPVTDNTGVRTCSLE